MRTDLKSFVIGFRETNQTGVALVVALMFMGALVFLGTTAIMTTTTDVKIGGNLRSSKQAFYAAQAGAEETRARLRMNAANPIHDDQPQDLGWRAYIGTVTRASEKGYDPDSGLHSIYDSLEPALDYTVEIRHQVDPGGNMVYWGDLDGNGVSGRNAVKGESIYLITSYGTADLSSKSVTVEATRTPSITVSAGLYAEAPSTLHGNNAYISGTDACGGSDKSGMAVTQPEGSVVIDGASRVTGVGGSEPDIAYGSTDMDVDGVVDSYKDLADFSYTVESATVTGTSAPGPGDGWGSPVPGPTVQDPSSCTSSHIVSYDTDDTYLKLSEGVSGCGILLVEGDLEIEGDFSWHGVVVVTGSVVFAGEGERNITGACIAGGSALIDVTGGSTSIVRCSSAVTDQTQHLPLRLLSWKEDV
jgi:hypothetical protein